MEVTIDKYYKLFSTPR